MSRRMGGWEELDIQKKNTPRKEGWALSWQDGRMGGRASDLPKTHPSKGGVGGVVIGWMDGRWDVGCQIYIQKTPLKRRGRQCCQRMPEKKKNPLR